MTYQEKKLTELLKSGGKLLHNTEHRFYYIILERANLFQPATAAYFTEEFVKSFNLKNM